MYLLGAVIVGIVIVGLLYVALTSSAGRNGATGKHSIANQQSSPSSSQYSGRPLVDDILRKRHGLSADTEREWSWSEVSRHVSAADCWLVVDGAVYDVTDFVEEHPGGVDAIMKNPGKDNTAGFYGPQHPEKVRQLIGEYYIGRIAS